MNRAGAWSWNWSETTLSKRHSSKNIAPLFAALGEETRLRLVIKLGDDGPTPIIGLAAGAGITRQAITKHLRVLEEAGLVRNHRRGRESVWQLEPKRLEYARGYLELISKQWDDALGRLRKLVEN